MNQLAEQPFTAYVGIDWADAKHDLCVQAAGSEERAFDRIVHKPERIEAWAQDAACYPNLGKLCVLGHGNIPLVERVGDCVMRSGLRCACVLANLYRQVG